MPAKCIICELILDVEISLNDLFICKDCLRKELIHQAINGDEQAKLILSKNKF